MWPTENAQLAMGVEKFTTRNMIGYLIRWEIITPLPF